MKRSQILSVLLAASVLIMTGLGLTLRGTVGREDPRLDGIMPLAVPLVMLQNRGSRTSPPLIIDTPQTSAPPTDEPTVPPVVPPATTQPSAPPTLPEEPTVTRPSFPPEPPLREADESYFDDALFIGDSRTVGLAAYGRLGKADYFANVGMSVFGVLSASCEDNQFSETTLEGLLSQKKYGKIYIMLGVNDVGYPFESFVAQYRKVISAVAEMAPDSRIVLEANLTVSRMKSQSDGLVNAENILAQNEEIRELARERGYAYLDANAFMSDSDGYLKSDLTGDGVHPYGTGYADWAQWLCAHAPDYE